MTSVLLLKVILLTLDLVTLQIKNLNRKSYEKRIKAIKADPRSAFKSKFGRVRHTSNKVSSSSPPSNPNGNHGGDNTQ